MTIKSLEQKKRQKTLLIIALGLLLITALVLYFGLWKKESIIPEKILGGESIDSGMIKGTGSILEQSLRKTELDFSFFTETILSFLKIHGEIPVERGATGRVNPFVPY